jgi:hypothetical protein
MTDQSLRSVSVCVRVTVKHFTRSDETNQSRSKKYLILWVCVCILTFVTQYAKRILLTLHSIVMCGLSVCLIDRCLVSLYRRKKIRMKDRVWHRWALLRRRTIKHHYLTNPPRAPRIKTKKDFLTLKYGTDWLSRNIGYTLHNNPEERTSRGSTRLHSVANSLWKRLCTRR